MRLLLLDTASLYFRAFFGVPDSLKAPDGTPVNAVRGLLEFIARLTSDYAPTHLVCCLDNNWRPSWRVELIPSYKAHRVVEETGGVDVEDMPEALANQLPIITTVLDVIGIATLGVDDYEADDIIGTLAAKAEMPVDVVTGDRDLFQLVDDARGVRVLYTARGVSNHEQVTEAVVEGKYGVRADQYADFAVLRGDPSDGLPGVKGVGDKTAATLLAKFGTLAGVQAAAGDPSADIATGLRAKIVDAGEYLEAAAQVVAVASDLAVPHDWDSLWIPAEFADPAAVEQITARWGLGGSVDRIKAALEK